MKSVLYVYSKQTRKECIMKKINLYLVLPVIVILFAFIDSYGQSAEEYFKAGREKYMNKDYKGAIDDHTKAIGLKMDYGVAYYNRGLSKAAAGDFKGAIADYNMSIELTLAEYANNKKTAEEQVEEDDLYFTNKIRQIEMMILANQYLSRGISKYRLKDYSGAIADYDKAINADSTHIDSYFERGFTKNENKDYNGAYADYDKLIKIDSSYAEAYNGRGYSSYQLFNYEAALNDYNKSIELNPEYDISYFERATLKISMSDFKGAIEDYSKAIELNPKYGDAYFGRGSVKSLLNDNDGACADLHKALEIGGEDINTVKEEIEKNCK